MNCEICSAGMPEGVDLHRLNVKGTKGRWTCGDHAWRFGSYAKRVDKKLPDNPLSDDEIDDCVAEYRAEHKARATGHTSDGGR